MLRLLVLLVMLVSLPSAGLLYAATDLVSQGVAEYKDESFEEAAVTLERALKKHPDNYEAVFYLGISYMQMLEFDKARVYLEKAAAMQPEDAKLGVHLGEAFYNLHEYKAAEKALSNAIANGAESARAHYFLGLTRYGMGEHDKAITSFEQAMQMGEGMKVKALYLMGMAHRNMGDQEASEAEFKQVKALAPNSPEAMQADTMLMQPLVSQKNYQLNITLGEQYDSNVVLSPSSSSAGVTVSRKHDYVTTLAMNALISEKINDDIGVSASYGFSQNFHNRLTFFDVQVHHIDVTPYISMEKDQAFLRVSADAIGVDYRRYMSGFGLMPGYVYDFGNNHRGTIMAGFQRKMFYWKDVDGNDNRDANNYQIGYTHAWNLPQIDSSLSASYVYDTEEAGGRNWRYYGHHGTLSIAYPVWDRFMLSAMADQYRQTYRNVNSFYGIRRNDILSTLSPTLEWKPPIGGTVKLNYSYTQSKSSISIYAYRREVFSASYTGEF